MCGCVVCGGMGGLVVNLHCLIVHMSSPNQYIVVSKPVRQWWKRYYIVSFALDLYYNRRWGTGVDADAFMWYKTFWTIVTRLLPKSALCSSTSCSFYLSFTALVWIVLNLCTYHVQTKKQSITIIYHMHLFKVTLYCKKTIKH